MLETSWALSRDKNERRLGVGYPKGGGRIYSWFPFGQENLKDIQKTNVSNIRNVIFGL